MLAHYSECIRTRSSPSKFLCYTLTIVRIGIYPQFA